MTHAEALQKVAKLLRLAQSPNTHEAALAASRAQEIMDRYKIEGIAADFEAGTTSEEPIADFKADLMDAETTQLDTWRCRLASCVAGVNECKVYLTGYPKRGFAIVGRASDAVMVRLMYSWLKGQVDKLAAKECAGCGRTFWNNWRIGCVETLARRMRDARAETVATLKVEAGNGLALVRLEKALATRERQALEVGQWMKSNLRLSSAGRRTFAANQSAREMGRAAGHRININAPQRTLAA